jgi:hypothetical protein
MKTSELIGPALDWAVAKCEGVSAESWHHYYIGTDPGDYSGDRYSFSTNWSQGGPIIEREDISFRKYYKPGSPAHGTCYARVCRESGEKIWWHKGDMKGPTTLIAAMRCYVASELGDEVDVPEELT